MNFKTDKFTLFIYAIALSLPFSLLGINIGIGVMKVMSALTIIYGYFFMWNQKQIILKNKIILFLLIYPILISLNKLAGGFREVTDMFLINQGYFAFVMPIGFVLGAKVENWKLLLLQKKKLFIVGCVFFVSLSILNIIYKISNIEFIDWSFFALFGIILMIWGAYNQNKQLALLYLTMYIVVSFVVVKRHLLLYAAMHVFFFFLFFVVKNPKESLKAIFLVIISVFVLMVSDTILENNASYHQYKTQSIEGMENKGLKNSRENFYDDFFSDLSFEEIVFGKGINGIYVSKILGVERTGLELGHLDYIMKIGIIPFLIMTFWSIRGIILSLTRSRNSFVKICGITVLLHYGMMFTAFHINATLLFFLFWMCLGASNSAALRKYSNQDIKDKILV